MFSLFPFVNINVIHCFFNNSLWEKITKKKGSHKFQKKYQRISFLPPPPPPHRSGGRSRSRSGQGSGRDDWTYTHARAHNTTHTHTQDTRTHARITRTRAHTQHTAPHRVGDGFDHEAVRQRHSRGCAGDLNSAGRVHVFVALGSHLHVCAAALLDGVDVLSPDSDECSHEVSRADYALRGG